jgi:hypothetical protein
MDAAFIYIPSEYSLMIFTRNDANLINIINFQEDLSATIHPIDTGVIAVGSSATIALVDFSSSHRLNRSANALLVSVDGSSFKQIRLSDHGWVVTASEALKCQASKLAMQVIYSPASNTWTRYVAIWNRDARLRPGTYHRAFRLPRQSIRFRSERDAPLVLFNIAASGKRRIEQTQPGPKLPVDMKAAVFGNALVIKFVAKADEDHEFVLDDMDKPEFTQYLENPN